MPEKIWPALRGLSWSLKKTPMTKTGVQRGIALGQESRVSYGPDPINKFDLSYVILRSDGKNELAQIEGFFLDRGGSLKSFLIDAGAITKNPAESSITGQALTIDVNSCAPLIRTTAAGYNQQIYELAVDGSGNPIEPVFYLDGVHLIGGRVGIYSSQQVATGFLDANGIRYSGVVIKFHPDITEGVTLDFSWMYRVRFVDDSQDFEMWHLNLWEAQSVKLIETRA